VTVPEFSTDYSLVGEEAKDCRCVKCIQLYMVLDGQQESGATGPVPLARLAACVGRQPRSVKGHLELHMIPWGWVTLSRSGRALMVDLVHDQEARLVERHRIDALDRPPA
jgi:hypothetical protein